MSKKQQCPPVGAPDWMVSYGDLMSLLLCFFVMLFSMSSMDKGKSEIVTIIMQDTFGTTRSAYVPFPGERLEQDSSGLDKNRSMTVNTIQQGNPTRSSMSVRFPKEKNVTGIVAFEDDSDTLGHEAIQTLAEIYNRVKGSPLMIEVRGHTGLSERGPNRDSMDLAYARAYVVRKYLIDKGINPGRIIVTSMGANKTTGTVSAAELGGSNAYVEVLLTSETPVGNSHE